MRPYKEILFLKNEKIIFLLSGKCASSSIRRLAINELGYGDKGDKWYSGLKYLQFCDLKEYERYKDYLKVMIVRNPYARMISLYNDKIVRSFYKNFKHIGLYKRCPFDFFIKTVCNLPDNVIDPHLRCQTVYYDYVNPDLIIRVEDWKGWEKTGLPEPKKHNVGKHVDWKKYYNEQNKKLVQKKYNSDFEILGYKK